MVVLRIFMVSLVNFCMSYLANRYFNSVFSIWKHYVTDKFLYFPGKAVIYGASFASYTFIQGILASGIPGSRLVMIHPPSNLPSCFNNPDVDELVEQSLENAGIQYCKEFCSVWS